MHILFFFSGGDSCAMTRFDILEAIENYGSMSYPAPKQYFGKTDVNFVNKAYQNWAVEELLDFLWKKEEIQHPVVCQIEEFGSMMGRFAVVQKNIDTMNMFSIAQDVATDILDFTISLLTWRDENE